jgi:hypothetical protein
VAGDAVATAPDADRETRLLCPSHRGDDVRQVGRSEDHVRASGRHRVVCLASVLVPDLDGLDDLTPRAAAKNTNRFT